MGNKRLSNYWKNRLGGENKILPHERPFYHWLQEKTQRSKRVLEVGVGSGRMINMLKSAHCSTEFYGIDLWSDKIYDRNYIALGGDARYLPFKNDSFDIVYSLGVVEHFMETSLAICEHARVVKKGGYVVVTVPRLSFYTIPRLIVFWIKGRKEGTFTEVIGKNLTLKFIKQCFEQAGLSIIRASAAGFNAPKISGFWETYIYPYLPERIFGAYLFCIGKKGNCLG